MRPFNVDKSKLDSVLQGLSGSVDFFKESFYRTEESMRMTDTQFDGLAYFQSAFDNLYGDIEKVYELNKHYMPFAYLDIPILLSQRIYMPNVNEEWLENSDFTEMLSLFHQFYGSYLVEYINLLRLNKCARYDAFENADGIIDRYNEYISFCEYYLSSINKMERFEDLVDYYNSNLYELSQHLDNLIYNINNKGRLNIDSKYEAIMMCSNLKSISINTRRLFKGIKLDEDSRILINLSEYLAIDLLGYTCASPAVLARQNGDI